MNICDTIAFQVAEKGWRPFMGWGLATAAVAFAWKAVFTMPFTVETFLALTGAAGVGFGVRAYEKLKLRGDEKLREMEMER